MKKVFRAITDNFEVVLMSLCLTVIAIIIMLQVIMRYVFVNTLAWPEELARYLFIWLAYLGLSYGVKMKSHLRIDIVETLVPALKRPIEYIGDMIFLGFCIFMIPVGIDLLQFMWGSWQTSPAMGIPMFFVSLSLFAGLVLSILRFIEKYVCLFLGRNKGEQTETEAPKEDETC